MRQVKILLHNCGTYFKLKQGIPKNSVLKEKIGHAPVRVGFGCCRLRSDRLRCRVGIQQYLRRNIVTILESVYDTSFKWRFEFRHAGGAKLIFTTPQETPYRNAS